MDPYADLQEKLRRKEELLREREEKVVVMTMMVVVIMMTTMMMMMRGAEDIIIIYPYMDVCVYVCICVCVCVCVCFEATHIYSFASLPSKVLANCSFEPTINTNAAVLAARSSRTPRGFFFNDKS